MKAESIYIIHRNPEDNQRWSCQLFQEGISRNKLEEAEEQMRHVLGGASFAFYGQLSEAQAIAASLNSEATAADIKGAETMIQAYSEAYKRRNAADRFHFHLLSVAEDEAKESGQRQRSMAFAVQQMGQIRRMENPGWRKPVSAVQDGEEVHFMDSDNNPMPWPAGFPKTIGCVKTFCRERGIKLNYA